LKIYKQL